LKGKHVNHSATRSDELDARDEYIGMTRPRGLVLIDEESSGSRCMLQKWALALRCGKEVGIETKWQNERCIDIDLTPNRTGNILLQAQALNDTRANMLTILPTGQPSDELNARDEYIGMTRPRGLVLIEESNGSWCMLQKWALALRRGKEVGIETKGMKMTRKMHWPNPESNGEYSASSPTNRYSIHKSTRVNHSATRSDELDTRDKYIGLEAWVLIEESNGSWCMLQKACLRLCNSDLTPNRMGNLLAQIELHRSLVKEQTR